MYTGVAERSAFNVAARIVRACLIGAVAAIAVPACVRTSYAQDAAATVSYSIPAGNLSTALTRWAQLSGFKLLAPSGVLKGRTTAGLSGSIAAEQALSTLLNGTGLVYTISGSTVTIADPSASGNNSAATVEGAIALDTIDVSGGRTDAEAAADEPYQTPGSTSHISREVIDRVPPISPGDVFINTPGVINAGNRVGTSINPNIRGMQGMGRINTTIDGARQTTSTYRGYTGNRDETYVDPDMIGGIDISKGPSDGVGVGGIGGSVNFRTLDASDIVKAGETTGSRVKTTLGSNGVAPPDAGTTLSADRPSFYGDTFSGSFATAVIKDNYEGIVAFSKRQQGNYFAGTKVPDGMRFGPGTTNPNAQILPGTEVFNTSEDTESLLAKGKVKSDEQSLELSYLYYGSKAGQVSDNFLVNNTTNEQWPLTNIEVDTYTARYRYTPADNPWVKARANLWLSDIDSDRFLGTIDKPYGTRTVGGDIGNTSVITTALGELTLDNGAEFVREHATAEQFASSVTLAQGWGTWGPSGVRLMASAFSKASLEATDWLTLSGGARYEYYHSEGEGYLTRYPERSADRVSPHAGIVLTPFEGIQLYGQYTEGFRPPSLRETHWHFQDVLFNNPDLRPEIAKNKEVGLNVLREDVALEGDKLRFKASLFDNQYDDYILRQVLPRRPGQTGNRYVFSNIDRATYQGFELSGGYDARKFFFEGAFTKYTKIEYCVPNGQCRPPTPPPPLFPPPPNGLGTDYVSNYIPPAYSGSFTAGFRAFDEKLTLGARTHFADVRAGSLTPLDSSRVGISVSWPKYQIFDVFGSYAFTDDVTANFSVENITDEYYFGALSSVGIPSPGRTVRLGLTRTLGGDAFPSMPDMTLGRAAEGAPGSDWTGLYFGGHIGYGVASVRGETTAGDGTPGGIPASESAHIDLDEQLRGFQLGVNYQLSNRVVVGAEADFSWSKLFGTQKSVATEGTLGQRNWLQAETDYDFDWTATLRGRVGYAFDRYLAYGTAGVAFLDESQIRTQYRSDSGSRELPFGRETAEYFNESATASRLGWTAGGGIEYALTNHWSLKGEYQFAHFGNELFSFSNARSGVTRTYTYQPPTIPCSPRPCIPTVPPPVTTPGSSDTTNGRKAANDMDLQTIQFGLNYRF